MWISVLLLCFGIEATCSEIGVSLISQPTLRYVIDPIDARGNSTFLLPAVVNLAGYTFLGCYSSSGGLPASTSCASGGSLPCTVPSSTFAASSVMYCPQQCYSLMGASFSVVQGSTCACLSDGSTLSVVSSSSCSSSCSITNSDGIYDRVNGLSGLCGQVSSFYSLYSKVASVVPLSAGSLEPVRNMLIHMVRSYPLVVGTPGSAISVLAAFDYSSGMPMYNFHWPYSAQATYPNGFMSFMTGVSVDTNNSMLVALEHIPLTGSSAQSLNLLSFTYGAAAVTLTSNSTLSLGTGCAPTGYTVSFDAYAYDGISQVLYLASISGTDGTSGSILYGVRVSNGQMCIRLCFTERISALTFSYSNFMLYATMSRLSGSGLSSRFVVPIGYAVINTGTCSFYSSQNLVSYLGSGTVSSVACVSSDSNHCNPASCVIPNAVALPWVALLAEDASYNAPFGNAVFSSTEGVCYAGMTSGVGSLGNMTCAAVSNSSVVSYYNYSVDYNPGLFDSWVVSELNPSYLSRSPRPYLQTAAYDAYGQRLRLTYNKPTLLGVRPHMDLSGVTVSTYAADSATSSTAACSTSLYPEYLIPSSGLCGCSNVFDSLTLGYFNSTRVLGCVWRSTSIVDVYVAPPSGSVDNTSNSMQIQSQSKFVYAYDSSSGVFSRDAVSRTIVRSPLQASSATLVSPVVDGAPLVSSSYDYIVDYCGIFTLNYCQTGSTYGSRTFGWSVFSYGTSTAATVDNALVVAVAQGTVAQSGFGEFTSGACSISLPSTIINPGTHIILLLTVTPRWSGLSATTYKVPLYRPTVAAGLSIRFDPLSSVMYRERGLSVTASVILSGCTSQSTLPSNYYQLTWNLLDNLGNLIAGIVGNGTTEGTILPYTLSSGQTYTVRATSVAGASTENLDVTVGYSALKLNCVPSMQVASITAVTYDWKMSGSVDCSRSMDFGYPSVSLFGNSGYSLSMSYTVCSDAAWSTCSVSSASLPACASPVTSSCFNSATGSVSLVTRTVSSTTAYVSLLMTDATSGRSSSFNFTAFNVTESNVAAYVSSRSSLPPTGQLPVFDSEVSMTGSCGFGQPVNASIYLNLSDGSYEYPGSGLGTVFVNSTVPVYNANSSLMTLSQGSLLENSNYSLALFCNSSTYFGKLGVYSAAQPFRTAYNSTQISAVMVAPSTRPTNYGAITTSSGPTSSGDGSSCISVTTYPLTNAGGSLLCRLGVTQSSDVALAFVPSGGVGNWSTSICTLPSQSASSYLVSVSQGVYPTLSSSSTSSFYQVFTNRSSVNNFFVPAVECCDAAGGSCAISAMASLTYSSGVPSSSVRSQLEALIQASAPTTSSLYEALAYFTWGPSDGGYTSYAGQLGALTVRSHVLSDLYLGLRILGVACESGISQTPSLTSLSSISSFAQSIATASSAYFGRMAATDLEPFGQTSRQSIQRLLFSYLHAANSVFGLFGNETVAPSYFNASQVSTASFPQAQSTKLAYSVSSPLKFTGAVTASELTSLTGFDSVEKAYFSQASSYLAGCNRSVTSSSDTTESGAKSSVGTALKTILSSVSSSLFPVILSEGLPNSVMSFGRLNVSFCANPVTCAQAGQLSISSQGSAVYVPSLQILSGPFLNLFSSVAQVSNRTLFSTSLLALPPAGSYCSYCQQYQSILSGSNVTATLSTPSGRLLSCQRFDTVAGAWTDSGLIYNGSSCIYVGPVTLNQTLIFGTSMISIASWPYALIDGNSSFTHVFDLPWYWGAMAAGVTSGGLLLILGGLIFGIKLYEKLRGKPFSAVFGFPALGGSYRRDGVDIAPLNLLDPVRYATAAMDSDISCAIGTLCYVVAHSHLLIGLLFDCPYRLYTTVERLCVFFCAILICIGNSAWLVTLFDGLDMYVEWWCIGPMAGAISYPLIRMTMFAYIMRRSLGVTDIVDTLRPSPVVVVVPPGARVAVIPDAARRPPSISIDAAERGRPTSTESGIPNSPSTLRVILPSDGSLAPNQSATSIVVSNPGVSSSTILGSNPSSLPSPSSTRLQALPDSDGQNLEYADYDLDPSDITGSDGAMSDERSVLGDNVGENFGKSEEPVALEVSIDESQWPELTNAWRGDVGDVEFNEIFEGRPWQLVVPDADLKIAKRRARDIDIGRPTKFTDRTRARYLTLTGAPGAGLASIGHQLDVVMGSVDTRYDVAVFTALYTSISTRLLILSHSICAAGAACSIVAYVIYSLYYSNVMASSCLESASVAFASVLLIFDVLAHSISTVRHMALFSKRRREHKKAIAD